MQNLLQDLNRCLWKTLDSLRMGETETQVFCRESREKLGSINNRKELQRRRLPMGCIMGPSPVL